MAEDLYTSMQKRMSAVQAGGPDPGNPDLYGYNQTTGAPGSSTPPPIGSSGTAGGQITGTSGVMNTQATVGAQTPQGQPTTVAGAFQQSLINRLAPGPVNAQSPEIAPAIQANQLAEQRNMERNRALLAERSAAQGTDASGGFETGLLGLAQDRAGREGQFAGNAVLQLAQQRQQELTAALALGGSLMSEQDRLAIQRELAQLDAQIRREGLQAQTQLGQGDLALREKLGIGNLNLGLASLLQGGEQFGQSLASNNAQFTAGLNQNALLQLLGGL